MTIKKRILAIFLCLIFVVGMVVQPVFANPVVPIVAGVGVAIIFSLIVGALGVSFPNNDSAYNSAYAAYKKVQESATLAPGLAAFMAAYQAGEAINVGKDFLLGLWNELQSLGFEAGKTEATTVELGPLSGAPAADFVGMDPWTLLDSQYIGVGYVNSTTGAMTVQYVLQKPLVAEPNSYPGRSIVYFYQLKFSDFFAGKTWGYGSLAASSNYGNVPSFYGDPIITLVAPTSSYNYFYFNATLVGADMSSTTRQVGGTASGCVYSPTNNPVFLGSKAIDDLVSGKNLQGADYYSGATTGALTNVGNMGNDDVVVVPNANVQSPSADVVSGDIIPGWLDDVLDPTVPGSIQDILEGLKTDVVGGLQDIAEWLDDTFSISIPDIIAWLQKIWQAILDLPANVIAQLKTAVKELFAIDTTYFQQQFDRLKTGFENKLPFIPKLKNVVDESLNALNSDEAPPPVSITVWGVKVDIIDLSIFQQYRDHVHVIMSALMWLGFAWRLYHRLPSYIGGYGGTGTFAVHSSGDVKTSVKEKGGND